MSKDHQRRQAARQEAAGIGDRAGKREYPVIVVGIGAPTGGIQSLNKIFAKLPAGHGVAFVVIPHPEPSRENLTPTLLRSRRSCPWWKRRKGCRSSRTASTSCPRQVPQHQRFPTHLQEPLQCNGLWMPVDHFFCSLAADQRGRACGIVLSGTGGDGTLGLSEIRVAEAARWSKTRRTPSSPQFPKRH